MKKPAFRRARLRLWWITNREQVRVCALFATLVALYLVASTMEYQDQLDQERARRERAERLAADVAATLAEERALRGIPNPAILMDATNAREFGLRLAELSGSLDAHRYQVLGGRKP